MAALSVRSASLVYSSAHTSTSMQPNGARRYVSSGHGDVDFGELVRALNRIGYAGPLSIEWEDPGMDRAGPSAAVDVTRRIDYPASSTPFYAAFAK